MGIFFYTHAVALAEDLSIDSNHTTVAEFYMAVDASYQQVLYVCLRNSFSILLNKIFGKHYRMLTTAGLLPLFTLSLCVSRSTSFG